MTASRLRQKQEEMSLRFVMQTRSCTPPSSITAVRFAGRFLQQGDGKRAVLELEVALVVEFQQCRTVGMVVLEMQVVNFGLVGCVATLFAHVDLLSSLFVGVLMLGTVHLQRVRLERAPLSERLVAHVTLVRTYAGVSSGVPFQVERIVESFAAERAQVSFDVTVALHVTVQETLESERFAAHLARQPETARKNGTVSNGRRKSKLETAA